MKKWACEKAANSEEEPCILGLRGKVNHKVDSPTHDSEHQPEEPYRNILEKPPPCASGLEAGGSEKPASSKMQGHLEHPANTIQPGPDPKQASSLHLGPASPPAAPAPGTKMQERAKLGHGRLPKPGPGLSHNTSSSRSPTPGLRFSFLKTQRQVPGPPEKAALQQDGPWKVLCSLYSPKPNRTKGLGKGKVYTRSAGEGTILWMWPGDRRRRLPGFSAQGSMSKGLKSQGSGTELF